MQAMTVAELLSWQAPNVKELIGGGILLPGGRMIIFGRWGTGKSLLLNHTAFCLTQGLPWLGFATNPCTVLVAQVEIPQPQLQDRVRKYVSAAGGVMPAGYRVLTEPYLRLDKPVSFSDFYKVIEQHRPQLVGLDPLYRMFSGNINDNYQVQLLLDRLDQLQATFNLGMTLVGHTRKPRTNRDGVEVVDDWGQELVGGSYIMDWVDTAIAMEAVSPDTVKLHFVKVRHAPVELSPFEIRFDRNTLHYQRVLPRGKP